MPCEAWCGPYSTNADVCQPVTCLCPESAANGPGPLAGTPILAPYAPLEALQQKRLAARRHQTTFCYDFPSVFANALRQAWAARAAAGEPDSIPPPGMGETGVLKLCFVLMAPASLTMSCARHWLQERQPASLTPSPHQVCFELLAQILWLVVDEALCIL